ncbi:MAG TPA: hypothetical protein VFO85_02405, partial [Vicinamibacteria bacterium]|nr:hypothetical protein [Vicinamibacteria bacterium]
MRPALVFLLASATPVLLFAQVPAGGEFRVSTAVQGQDGHTDVAARRDGAYVVAWSSTLADGSVFGVLARVYDAAGQPMGAAFLANTVTTGPQFFPAVAAAPKGGFLVVWEGSGSGPPGTFDDSGIFARAFDADGTPRAGQFMVNAYATGAQYFAHATAVGNAGFVVTWWSRHDNGTVGGFARRLRPDGQPLGAEFQVNSYTTGDQLVTGIAADPAGNFVVAWASPQDGSDYGVMARRYDRDAVPLGVEFQVNSQTTGVQWGPSVAIDGGGRFVVTWIGATAEDPVYGIRGQRFDAAGQRLGGEFRVNTYTTGFQTSGRVRSDESGNFTATWESLGQDGSSWGVYGQRFGASGQPRGAEFAVNTSTTGEQGLPHLASDPSGNVLVAWRSAHVDPVFDIYAQRFGGLQPAALDVNTFGNGIFEPGEVVDVAPSWRNVHGAALTFGGTAVSFTGPQPATYQIHTAFANYSLVPDG